MVAYFAVGAYYNYSTYGATGFDLIPYVLLFCIYTHTPIPKHECLFVLGDFSPS